MNVANDNFINMDSNTDKIVNIDDHLYYESWQDPLQVQNEAENTPVQSYYRMDRIVFAEPINSLVVEDSNSKATEDEERNEMFFIDNVVVEKRKGRKNKKYHIDVDFTNPVCPQSNCKRKFSTTTLLRAHIRKIHCSENNAYVCDICGNTFKAQFMLKRHSAVHEKRRVQCQVCNVMLSERTNMSQHLRSHSNTRKHECQTCHKLFLRKSTLNVHVKFVHRNGDLKCNECDSRFESRSQLSQHRSTHKQMVSKV